MRSTLTVIAREAGVSPATVDRVLNNREGVKTRTREIVLQTAQRLGYLNTGRASSTANVSGQLARLTFVLPSGTNTFIKTLHAQIEQQAAARPDLDVRIEVIEAFDPATLAARLTELQGQTQGVGVVALDHPIVREAIRGLSANGIQVVTLVSDILHVPRAAYVGIDNRQAGRLAGYILGRFLGKGAKGKVALFAGSLSYRGHQEREMGFRHVLHDEFPNLEVVALREMQDDRERARSEALSLLDTHSDLAAIYNVGAGNPGIASALKDRGRNGSVILIGHEATEANKALLIDGTLDAVIDQNPRVEAREALNVLSNAVRGLTYNYVAPRLQIIFRENLPDE